MESECSGADEAVVLFAKTFLAAERSGEPDLFVCLIFPLAEIPHNKSAGWLSWAATQATFSDAVGSNPTVGELLSFNLVSIVR